MTEITADSSFLNFLNTVTIGTDNNYSIPYGIGNYSGYAEIFEFLYEVNNYAANIVDLLPESMGQKAPIIKYPDPNVNGILQDKLTNVIPHFIQAAKVARLTGGSGILMNARGKLEDPITKYRSDITAYNVLEGGLSGELKVHEIDRNPQSEDYLKPLYYRLKFSNDLIHASRILPFYGITPLTKRQKRANQYWGVPVLIRCYEALKELADTDRAIAKSIAKFSRLIIKIKDLNELLKTPKGKEQLKARSDQLNFGWTYKNLLILEIGEEVSNLNTEFNEVIEAAEYVKHALASKTDIPFSMLFNSSPASKGLAGSKASSQSVDRGDERQWANYVGKKLVNDWQPNIYHAVDVWLYNLGIVESEKYEIEHPSILEVSEPEKISNDKTVSDTNLNYYNMGVANSSQIATSLKEGTSLGSAIAKSDDLAMNEETLKQAAALTGQTKVTLPAITKDSESLIDVAKERENLKLMLENGDINSEDYDELISILSGYKTAVIDDSSQESLNIDDATRSKRLIDWNGFKIGVQYFPFDLRHGKMLICGYGHFQRTLSDDGMAADVFLSTANLNNGKIFKIDQWIDGKFDEVKYIIGVNTIMEAKDLYCSCMPAEFIGGLQETNVDEIKQLQKRYEEKYGK